MAASFPGGVVLGADTRTSTGSYVANRVTNKLTQLADKVLVLACRRCFTVWPTVTHNLDTLQMRVAVGCAYLLCCTVTGVTTPMQTGVFLPAGVRVSIRLSGRHAGDQCLCGALHRAA